MPVPEDPTRPAPRRVAPPPAISARDTVNAGGSGRWRINNEGLLEIESGAVLPEVCIYGSEPGTPGQRIALVLPYKRLDGEPPEEVRVTAYQSSQRAHKLKRMRTLMAIILPPLAACLVGFLLRPDPFFVVLAAALPFGVLMAWDEGRGLAVCPAREPGWWILTGVDRKTIARLDKEVGQDFF